MILYKRTNNWRPEQVHVPDESTPPRAEQYTLRVRVKEHHTEHGLSKQSRAIPSSKAPHTQQHPGVHYSHVLENNQ